MRFSSIILTASVFLFFFSCKNNVSPPERRNPRNYTWTKTVIGDGSYQIIPRDIWGSSPKDVYAVGHGASFAGKILRFDGSQWTDLSTKYIEAYAEAHPGVQVFNWDPQGVFGFSPNDVWIVGSRDTGAVSQQFKEGFVIRFNGQTWREVLIPATEHLFAIRGTSQTDVWVGGLHGSLLHFDGTSWSDHSVPDTITVNFFAGILNSESYALGFNASQGVPYFSLLAWNGSTWRIAEISVGGSSRPFDLFDVVGNGLYSVTPAGINRRVAEGSWMEVYSFASSSSILNRIKGSSETNMLAIGGPGEIIIHFDGNDWARLSEFADSEITYANLLVFDSEVFVIGRNSSATLGYFVHGK